MVCRSELGRPSQELRRLPADRSAGVYRHDGMEDGFECGAQVFPQRHRGQASAQENRWKRQAKSGDFELLRPRYSDVPGKRRIHGRRAEERPPMRRSAGGIIPSRTVSTRSIGRLMQEHLRVYTAYLWELTTAPVLPFRFAPVSKQISDRLEELRVAGKGVGLETALDEAARFANAVARLDSRAAHEAEQFAGSRGSEQAALLLNRTIKRLSRILVPLQSSSVGSYGHDTYGLHATNDDDPVPLRPHRTRQIAGRRAALDAGNQDGSRPQSGGGSLAGFNRP